MKKLLLLFLMSALAYSLSAQDVIYTVTGKINDQTTSIDSILVENISNNTRILFGDLPDLPDYNINLTQKAFWGATGIKKFGTNKSFFIRQNTPGTMVIVCNENQPARTNLSVFNANGQEVYGFKNRNISKGQAIKISLGETGLFIIKIKSELGIQTFKAMGSPFPKARPVYVNITGQLAAVHGFKATKAALDDGFSFSLGDSLRFTVYNSKYFAAPISFKVSRSGSLVFNFNEKKGTFTDPRDKKTYKTVKIGTQTWMAENLAYLPSVDSSSNGSETDPRYYVYDYQGNSVSDAKATDNYTTYGVLYNWPAAKAACPSGWHLPTDEEWKTLEMYLGMSQSAADSTNYRGTDEGKKLKSTSGWYDGGNGTDEVGFSALPGGYRYSNGNVYDLGSYGMWWSTAVIGTAVAWNRALSYGIDKVFRNLNNRAYGYSVRCVRDSDNEK